MNIWKRGALGLGVGIVLILAVLLFGNGQAEASVGTLFSRFRALLVDDSVVIVNDCDVGDDLAVSGDTAVTGAATVGSTLEVTGASTLTGAVTTGAGITVGTVLNTAAATSITITDNIEIVPTGSYQPIAAAANVGTDSITTTGFIAGDWVTFINTSDTTITITDTGTVMLSGDAALTQYDTLTLLFDGTNWIEIAQTAN